MDVHTKEQRRKNMQAIKSTGTKDEVLLAKSLWHKGSRYRKNNKKVFGKPDLTFKKHQLAIFLDSEIHMVRTKKIEELFMFILQPQQKQHLRPCLHMSPTP